MSFASDIRDELARMPCDRQTAALGELCAVALCSGGLSFRGNNQYALAFYANNAEAAERYLAMAKRYLDVDCALGVFENNRLGGQTRYAVMPADVHKALSALDLLDPAMPFGLRVAPSAAITDAPDADRAFLRGAFLTCGSMIPPQTAYHLEFALTDEALAFSVIGLIERHGIRVGLFERKNQVVVYLKESEAIGDLLRLMGANRAVLALENVRILKELRNGVNRQTNCDNSNVEKMLLAAERQTSFIQAIARTIGLTQLPAPLRDIALLRLQYPDASLADLGEMATPKIGKSGVSARMRKLEAIAQALPDE